MRSHGTLVSVRGARTASVVTVALALCTGSAAAQTLDDETPGAEPQSGETMLAPTLITPDPSARPRRIPPPRHNTITWQPVTIAFATIDLEYERVIARYFTAYLAPAIVPGIVHEPSGGTTPFIYGVAADLGLRYFPWGLAPRGMFMGVYGGLASFADSSFGGRSRGFGARVGSNVGYTLILFDLIDLSAGIGLEYSQFTRAGTTYQTSNVAVTARLAIGVAF